MLPFLKYEQIWATVLFVLVVIGNRKFGLGLTTQDLIMIGGACGIYTAGESLKDALAQRAAAPPPSVPTSVAVATAAPAAADDQKKGG